MPRMGVITGTRDDHWCGCALVRLFESDIGGANRSVPLRSRAFAQTGWPPGTAELEDAARPLPGASRSSCATSGQMIGGGRWPRSNRALPPARRCFSRRRSWSLPAPSPR
jgi:hypothetical protein